MSEKLSDLESRVEELELRIVELSPPQLMTTLEVAKYLGVSERQFYAWKREGDAPKAIYFSERTVRYDRHDVVAWGETKKAS